jgi:hypothetical protein
MNRLAASCSLAIVGFACVLVNPASAQPGAAAWLGTSPLDSTAYDLAENWLDLGTGGAPKLPPDATSAVFFGQQAAQAPRDPLGNIVVSLRSDDLGAQSMSVQVLPFRFIGGGTLQVGLLAVPEKGILSVQEGGVLSIDAATLDVRDSVIVSGGTRNPSGIEVLAGGSLFAGDAISLSNAPESFLRLIGGTVRAARIDTGFDSSQFQWTGGQLSFDEFRGDLNNPSGELSPGAGAALAMITGSYSQSPDARLDLQIGGTTLGQNYDHLDISGALNAGGTLAVSFLDDFTPSAGNEFDLLDFASLSGVFENVILPGLPSGLEWDVASLHSQGIIRVIQPGVPVSPAMWSGGAADGDYFNPANWANGIVPVNAENASFGVSIPGGAVVSLSGDQAVDVTGFVLSAGGTFNVSADAALEVLDNASISGAVSVVGQGASFSTGDGAADLVGAPRLTVSQGGLLQVGAPRYGITADPGTSVLLAATDPGSMLDLSSLQELSVDIGTNSSFFVSASDGADINLAGLESISGAPGGLGRLILRADSGGGLHFTDLEVSGRANVEAAGSLATIDVDGSLDLHAASRLSLTGGAALQIEGDLLYDIATASDFNTSGGVIHFQGDGMQMLEVGGQDLGQIAEGGPTSGNFGAGRILVGQEGTPTTLVLMDAANNGGDDAAEALYLFGVGGASGLEILDGSTLRMSGLNVHSNSVASEGQIVLDGMLTATGTVLNNGTLSGNGMVAGEMFLNNGILSPGNSSGEIDIDGDVESGGESVMQIEIGGPTPATQHDKIKISKTMILDGGLEVTLIDGGMGVFEPNKGDEFEILTANGGISGTFTSLSLPPLPAALGWQLFYEPTAISLGVLPRLEGDCDADGDVDRDDLEIWQSGVGMLVGASQTDGDSDGDGDVDGADLRSLLLNFGASPSDVLPGSPSAVPEPNALVLASACFALAAIRIAGKCGSVARPESSNGVV